MTMTFIASSTVTGSPNAFAATFFNIPQTFTHLQLRASTRGTNATIGNFILIQLNNQTAGSFYRAHWLRGDGSTAVSGNAGPDTYINMDLAAPGANATSNVFGASIIDILDYTNTNKLKTLRALSGFDNNGSGYVGLYSGLYFENTNAINSILVYLGNAAVGSRVDLYGITTSTATGA